MLQEMYFWSTMPSWSLTLMTPQKPLHLNWMMASLSQNNCLFRTVDLTKTMDGFLNGKSMNLLFRGQAPELGLHGLHSGFFSYDQGCSIKEGCIPNSEATSTEAATTMSNLASTLSFSNTVFSIVGIITLLCRNLWKIQLYRRGYIVHSIQNETR